jgi:hypothetical protein
MDCIAMEYNSKEAYFILLYIATDFRFSKEIVDFTQPQVANMSSIPDFGGMLPKAIKKKSFGVNEKLGIQKLLEP